MKAKIFFIGFRNGMKEFGFTFAIIVNSLLLSIIYVFGIGSTAILAKIFRKRFLETEIKKDNDTYWDDLDLKKKPLKEYYRQF